MERATLRSASLVLALLGASACFGTAPAPEVSATSAPALPLPDPGAVGTIAVIEIVLPDAGSTIGGVFGGRQFQVRQGDMRLTDGARLRIANQVRSVATAMLGAAGFTVRPVSAPTSNAEAIPDVRFAISASTRRVDVREFEGRNDREATVVANWELLDIASSRTLLGMDVAGEGKGPTGDEALVDAYRASFRALLSQHRFRLALGTPRSRVDELDHGPSFTRPLIGARDTVVLRPADWNESASSNAQARVAAALFSLRGTRGRTSLDIGGILLTRDGVAIAGRVGSDVRQLRAVFANGVERTVRVVRERNGVALLQVACADPCQTAHIEAEPWPPRAIVSVMGATSESFGFGPATRAEGTIGGRCGIRGGPQRTLPEYYYRRAGDAVSWAGTPTVSGIVARRSGALCGVPLRSVFEWLMIRVDTTAG